MNIFKFFFPLGVIITGVAYAFAGSASYSSNGSFTVPAGITTIYVTASAYGGNGSDSQWILVNNGAWNKMGSRGGQGGGVENRPITVIPGRSYPVSFSGAGVSFAGLTLTPGTSGVNPDTPGISGTPGPSNGQGSESFCIPISSNTEEFYCGCSSAEPGGGGGGGQAGGFYTKAYEIGGCQGGDSQVDISWSDEPTPSVEIKFSYFINILKGLFAETALALTEK